MRGVVVGEAKKLVYSDPVPFANLHLITLINYC